jgi:hypothetical protein
MMEQFPGQALRTAGSNNLLQFSPLQAGFAEADSPAAGSATSTIATSSTTISGAVVSVLALSVTDQLISRI